jgi:hypothetical protein
MGMQKLAEVIVGGGNEPESVRMPHPTEGPNGRLLASFNIFGQPGFDKGLVRHIALVRLNFYPIQQSLGKPKRDGFC